MPSIYSYSDYRKYLKDVAAEMRGKNRHFSQRVFNRKLGFNSPNFLNLVMLGKRNISFVAVHKLAERLGLDERETKFFEHLVMFNQSEVHEERQKHYRRLCHFRAFLELKRLDHDAYLYFSRWYYAAIRELLLMANFREQGEWLAKRLNGLITVEQARDAVALLLRLGLVRRDARNRLVPVDKNIESDDEVQSLSLMNFHREMIGKAFEALEKTPRTWREIGSATVGIDYKTFHKAKRRLREFRREMLVLLSESERVEAVYQMNFQFFNLSDLPPRWREYHED